MYLTQKNFDRACSVLKSIPGAPSDKIEALLAVTFGFEGEDDIKAYMHAIVWDLTGAHSLYITSPDEEIFDATLDLLGTEEGLRRQMLYTLRWSCDQEALLADHQLNSTPGAPDEVSRVIDLTLLPDTTQKALFLWYHDAQTIMGTHFMMCCGPSTGWHPSVETFNGRDVLNFFDTPVDLMMRCHMIPLPIRDDLRDDWRDQAETLLETAGLASPSSVIHTMAEHLYADVLQRHPKGQFRIESDGAYYLLEPDGGAILWIKLADFIDIGRAMSRPV